MKTTIRLIFFRLCFVTLLLLAFVQNSFADNVVGYDLTADENSTIGQTGTFSVSAGLTTPVFSGYAQSSGWDAGSQYWTISPFNTTGLHTITVGAFMNSDEDGPKDFQLQYKLSGGSWQNAGAVITVKTSEENKNITLPDECSNVTGLEVRWLNSSSAPITTTVDNGGFITATANSYIRAISILGSLPTRPNTQATGITFTSITPTTITVDATQGNGSHRIIYIVKNTTGDVAPTFPDPADDTFFTANADYSTGTPTGYQVIYNGTTTNVTVTVPSSTNEYWFRIYEYNLNGTMPRFYTPAAANNPRLCALPTIVSDPATSIRLTTATIGATASSNARYPITARGTQWKITSASGANTTTNKTAEGGSGNGSFTKSLTGQTRGSRFYFRGYATNATGTIYSDELYYENKPIFSGTGTWETAGLWNVQQVPGSTGTGGFGNVADKPFIDGTCTLSATNSVTTLTINSGKTLNIAPGAMMTTTTLTNNGGNAGLVIQANSSGANGSLKWTNPTGNSQVGTVEMWSKAYTDDSSYPAKNRWQYFGIPVTSLTLSSTFAGSDERVRKYDESNTDANAVGLWVPADANHTNIPKLAGNTVMAPVDGYEVVQTAAKKYSFAGTLNHTAVSRTLTYSGGPYIGNHILSNPFTAAVNIAALTFSGSVENAVYLYNTGSRDNWSNPGSSEPGYNPGTYVVSTPLTAGNAGVPANIPSMQGFLVKATGAVNTFGMPLSSLVVNTVAQRAPAVDKVSTMIDVIGGHSSDRMWIFSDESCTSKFDNGWDGPKLLGSALNTQIYAMGEDGNYQINAVNNINNTNLGFQAGQDQNFKLVFNHTNLDQKYVSLYLVDLVDNKTVDIKASGSEYSFTSSNTDPVKRFKIIGTTNSTTSTIDAKSDDLRIINQDNKLIIDCKMANGGKLQIFDLSGKLQTSFNFDGNAVSTLTPSLQKGIYVAHLSAGSYSTSQRLIIK